jgi:DNA-binding SARP family transcriptional activator
MLRLQLLGAPTIVLDGRPAPLSAQKAQALLFYLAAEPGRPHTRGQLIALLWEESGEREGRNSLSTTLSRLRQALPAAPVRADGDTLAWDPTAGAQVDLHEFEALAHGAQDLEGAAALYRGPFLDGFEVRESVGFEEWLRAERERWQYRALNALDQLVARASAAGELERALDYARRALAVDPFQERFHRALMRLLAGSGDRAAAVAQFRACRELLERELGVEPDPETVALDEAIRAGRAEPLPARRPAPEAKPAVPPAARLAGRLEAARRHSFVGREAELALFAEALAGDPPPFTVLHLVGPGGVGKSALLAAFARRAADAGVPVLAVDGRAAEPTPDGVEAALREQLDGPLAALPPRVALLVDTYELLMPVESWLRDTLLPQLPEHALVVLAGRAAPSAAWRLDPGWQAVSRVVRLDNLAAADGHEYLRRRGIPPEQHEAVLRATHGFPLGLSLAAEVILQHPGGAFGGFETPDVVQTLLERFLDQVPSVAHRAALEAASQVRVMDEPLLAAMLAGDGARELFDWLRGLSFVGQGRRGVFLHDLAREALAADLGWRNPPWHHELHQRARAFFMARFERGGRAAQQQALLDLIFLHESPLIRSAFSWNDIGGYAEDTPRPDDWAALSELVARHEGAESARIAARWFVGQPDGVTVIRDAQGQPAGFNCILALRAGDGGAGDPCVEAALRFMQSLPPLDEGEVVAVDRFWMDREAYQGLSPAQGLIFITAIRFMLRAHGLAASFHVFADPEAWRPAIEQARFTRLPEADFVVGGRRYGIFFHDWRAEPPLAWLDALAAQEPHV